jgi:hypothetical protein
MHDGAAGVVPFHLIRPSGYRGEMAFSLRGENIAEPFLDIGVEMNLRNSRYNLVACCQ